MRNIISILLIIFIIGCLQDEKVTFYPGLQTDNTDDPVSMEVNSTVKKSISKSIYKLSHFTSSGNKYVNNSNVNLPESKPLDIKLSGKPKWILSSRYLGGILWVAVHEDGKLEGIHLVDGEVSTMNLSTAKIKGGKPISMYVSGKNIYIIHRDWTGMTNPILIGRTTIYTSESGSFILDDYHGTLDIKLNALPDSRLLSDNYGNVLFLSDPTDEYNHGVLGDQIEAKSITLVNVLDELKIINRIYAPTGKVFEGLYPIWADIDGDNIQDVIITVSDPSQGARIIAYDIYGNKIAESPPVGIGYRWTHQIALAPTGPNGETELITVKTPHLDGIVEYYRLNGNHLELVADIKGFSSHQVGSRNLDMSVVGDFDADGVLELLVPTKQMRELSGISRTKDDAILDWSIDVGGKITTNIAIAEDPDGNMVVGVGRDDEYIRVWMPESYSPF